MGQEGFRGPVPSSSSSKPRPLLQPHSLAVGLCSLLGHPKFPPEPLWNAAYPPPSGALQKGVAQEAAEHLLTKVAGPSCEVSL